MGVKTLTRRPKADPLFLGRFECGRCGLRSDWYLTDEAGEIDAAAKAVKDAAEAHMEACGS